MQIGYGLSRPQHLCARGFQLPSDACAAPTLLSGSTRARLAAAATPSRSPAPCALGARLHPVVGPALPEYRTRRRLLFCFASTQDLDLGAPPDRRHCLQTQAPQSPLVCAACLSSRSSGSTDSHGRQGKRASERPARTKAGSSHGPANAFFSYAGLGEAQQQQRPEAILQEVPRVGLNPALMAAGASAFVRGPCAPCCAASRRLGVGGERDAGVPSRQQDPAVQEGASAAQAAQQASAPDHPGTWVSSAPLVFFLCC